MGQSTAQEFIRGIPPFGKWLAIRTLLLCPFGVEAQNPEAAAE
jgi:hypothetical protein